MCQFLIMFVVVINSEFLDIFFFDFCRGEKQIMQIGNCYIFFFFVVKGNFIEIIEIVVIVLGFIFNQGGEVFIYVFGCVIGGNCQVNMMCF